MPKGGRRTPSTAAPLTATRLDAEAIKIGAQTSEVRIGGSTQSLSMTEAVIRKLFETAMKGSPLAQKSFLDLVDRAERLNNDAIDAMCDRAEVYREAQAKLIAAAEARGEDTSLILPHPDDIVIERGTGVRFAGPADEQDLKRVMNNAHIRDAFLYQDTLEFPGKLALRKNPPLLGEPLSFVVIYNNTLPARMKLSDHQIVLRMMKLRCSTRREHLKATRAAWLRAGVRQARGKFLLPPAKMARVLEIAYASAPRFAGAKGNERLIMEIAEDVVRQINSVEREAE